MCWLLSTTSTSLCTVSLLSICTVISHCVICHWLTIVNTNSFAQVKTNYQQYLHFSVTYTATWWLWERTISRLDIHQPSQCCCKLFIINGNKVSGLVETLSHECTQPVDITIINLPSVKLIIFICQNTDMTHKREEVPVYQALRSRRPITWSPSWSGLETSFWSTKQQRVDQIIRNDTGNMQPFSVAMAQEWRNGPRRLRKDDDDDVRTSILSRWSS